MKHRVSNRGAKLLAHILVICLLLSLVAPGLSVGATQATPETVPVTGEAGGVEAAQEVQSEGVSVTPIDGSAVSAELAMGQEAALPEDAIDLQAPYAADEEVRVVIVMEEKPVLEAGFATRDLPANFPALRYRLSLVAN